MMVAQDEAHTIYSGADSDDGWRENRTSMRLPSGTGVFWQLERWLNSWCCPPIPPPLILKHWTCWWRSRKTRWSIRL